jgi:hypothetical protein
MDEGWAELLENKFKGDNFSLYEQFTLPGYANSAGTLSDYPMITAEAGMGFSSFKFLYLEKSCIALLHLEELMGEGSFAQVAESLNSNRKAKLESFFSNWEKVNTI